MDKHTQGLLQSEYSESAKQHFVTDGSKIVALISTHSTMGKKEANANADRIVKCWNTHNRLIESLSELLGFIERNMPNEDGEAIFDAKAILNEAK